MAVLDRPDAAADQLAAAARLAALMGGGRVQALVVRMPPIATIMPTEEVLTAEREAEIRADQEKWAAQLKAAFDAWSAGLPPPGTETGWTDVEADLGQTVAEHGGRAAAVVVAQPGPDARARTRQIVHAALFDSGKPVLVVPGSVTAEFGRVAAVLWKEDERVPKAVLSAAPILRQAARVHVLHASEGGEASPEMPSVLREHGIAAELHVVSAHDGSAGERLLAAAHELGADMLVMGAYGHGEWREALFGGVTHHMLHHADLPVWMQH